MPSGILTRLPGRQVLLFLTAILAPCLVLVALSVRMIEQERQLEEKRAREDRERRAAQLRHELFSALEKIKTQQAARRGTSPAGQVVALVAMVRDGRLLLPWETGPQRERFRQRVGEAAFAATIRQAEREENTPAQLDNALRHYREVLASAGHPEQQAWARLLLARTLRKTSQRDESLLHYEQLVRLPLTQVDEHGIPLALYAAPPLMEDGRWKAQAHEWIRAAAADGGRLPPVALHMLRELAAGLGAQDLERRLVAEIRDHEQAEALQNDWPRLMPALSAQEIVWVAHGEPRWLVSISSPGSGEAMAVAARAAPVLASLGSWAGEFRLVNGRDANSQPLGESFPGLAVVLPASAANGGNLRRSFLGSALGLVLAVTLFAGYLLWRDLRRESRLAELRSQFVSSVSHELRTPLTSIRLSAEALWLEDDLDRNTQSQYLEIILNESQRLSRLVDNVLDFSKIERGKRMYDLRPVSPLEVVESAARVFAYPLEQSGFKMEIHAEPDLPPIAADRDALQQAILNLLSNAMKYSGDSRWIGLRLGHENGCVAIRVVDRGVGIAPEHQARIFERFYRGPAGENQRVPGAGRGLTLVAHVAKAHGGSVEVESAPGEGSAFIIRLPIRSTA